MVKFELFGRTQIFSSEVPESLTVGASLTYTDFFYWQLAFCSNFKGKHSAPTPPYFVAVSTFDAKATPQVNL